jgi:hypothetical protein
MKLAMHSAVIAFDKLHIGTRLIAAASTVSGRDDQAVVNHNRIAATRYGVRCHPALHNHIEKSRQCG